MGHPNFLNKQNIILACLMIVGSVSGCDSSSSSSSSSSNPPPVVAVPAPAPTNDQPNPNPPMILWVAASENTHCEAISPSFCQGRYGFQVGSDGTYIVGPSPSGTRIVGSISPNELNRFITDVNAVAASLGNNPVCAHGRGIPGASDEISIIDSNGNSYLAYEKNIMQYCYLGNQQFAINLANDLHSLMNKYYPRPFPKVTVVEVHPGIWGTTHFQLNLNSNGGTFKLNCANGTVDQSLILDENNQFHADGTITITGGAVIPGHTHTPIPASIDGVVSGNKMRIFITWEDSEGKDVSEIFDANFGESGTFNSICAFQVPSSSPSDNPSPAVSPSPST